jgi:hypothetical protein
MHQGSAGEIHGAVPMARHQRMDFPEFRILDRQHQQGTGAQKLPRCFHLPPAVANQMKQFRQHCLGGDKGKAELAKCVRAEPVPPIRSVQQSQNGSRIDESVTAHESELIASGADVAGLHAARSPIGGHPRPRRFPTILMQPDGAAVAPPRSRPLRWYSSATRARPVPELRIQTACGDALHAQDWSRGANCRLPPSCTTL